MIECAVDPEWTRGRFRVVFSSAAAQAEWTSFVRNHPEAARRAFERLSSEPLTRIRGRQFPLKGQANKPFWEYEAGKAFRIYYAADIREMTVIIAARNDAHTGPEVGALVRTRRANFDREIARMEQLAEQVTAKAGAKEPKKKRRGQQKPD